MGNTEALSGKNLQDIIPLTPAQEGILYHYLLEPGNGLYQEQLCMIITGEIDLPLFESTWNFLAQTNDMLRTFFRWREVKDPVQITLKKYDIPVKFYDFPGKDEETKKKLWEELKIDDRNEPFDLNQVPFRIKLGKIKKEEYEMIITHHHILYDGWSTGIILREFFINYRQLNAGNRLMEPRKSKFKEYLKWLQKPNQHKAEYFWRHYLQEFAAQTEIPFKKKKIDSTAVQSRDTENYRVELSNDFNQQLEKFTGRNKVAAAALFYTAWGILLQKCNDSGDVVFGTVLSGRSAAIKGIEDIVGMFINTLPLRINNDGRQTVLQLAKEVDSDLQAIREHEATPLAKIRQYNASLSKEELFESIIVIENYPLDQGLKQEGSALSIRSYSVYEINHYPLTVVVELFDGSRLRWIYNRELFDQESISRLARYFLTVLYGSINFPGRRTREIELISSEEKRQLLVVFNDTQTVYPAEKTLHQLFQDQEEQSPNRAALVYRHKQLTYRELNKKADRLAHRLRSKGVSGDTLVALLVERSVEMMIGLLGILKAGGAYLPLEPGYPNARLRYMLQDSSIRWVLAQKRFRERLDNTVQVIDLDESEFYEGEEGNPEKQSTAVTAVNLAYIIYTSGSTGKSKGVMIRHRSVVDRLNWMQRFYPLDATDIILQITPFSFDVSVWELFWWALNGARVCFLDPGAEKDPGTVSEIIGKNRISTVHFVPSLLSVFLEYVEVSPVVKRLSSLKRVFASGEALGGRQVEIFNRLLRDSNGTKLVNAYGPTEATIYASYFDCSTVDKNETIPIGKAIDNVKLYILDKNQGLQPIGIKGELYISGDGLARGYLNRPELTAEKFVISHWSLFNSHSSLVIGSSKSSPKKNDQCPMNNDRSDRSTNDQCLMTNDRSHQSPLTTHQSPIYKTGDLARWLPEGNIEFLGRVDDQVKIRGFRIELGEIEERLRTHKDIKEAVVVAKGDENVHLYAYIVSRIELTVVQLRNFLSRYLPGYMIPSYFTGLDKLPVLQNGKVDRKRLIALEDSRPNLGVTYTAPGSEVEKKITDTWKDVLKTEKVGIHDNFFDLGGNSLMLIRLNRLLSEAFGKDIPIAVMFRCPTVHLMARCLVDGEEGKGIIKSDSVEVEKENRQSKDRKEIAVIGMAGRFPGAGNVYEFWENLKNGLESITFFSQDTLRKAGVEEDLLKKPDYVNAQGVLENLEYFDAVFFGYNPREAEMLDPQVRLFLECSWEALEDAGYDPGDYHGSIGLYAGASPNFYWEALSVSSGKGDILGIFTAEKLMNKDYLSKWVSYKLNFNGPSISIYTACSTSLVAIHLACEALANNDCHMALAGGVTTVPLPDKTGYLYQEGMVMSPDGRCRAFDAQAGGFVGGKGVGIVVLKPLQEAVKKRDNIHAVIKGSAVNNDGIRKVGFSAPSVDGQAENVRAALKKANVPAESIAYIDAHGTGTGLGDPVEIEALKAAFNTGKKGYCGIGSVKTNIGHLDTAAGIASFIKVVLALKYRKIPPTINFNTPNPKIDFVDSPFFVNTGLVEWENNSYPLRAGVNSLGVGGTNAHVILEEAPVENGTVGNEYQLILLSARTETALDRQQENLAVYLKRNPAIPLADAAYTLQLGRRVFDCREMLVSRGIDETIDALSSSNSQQVHRFSLPGGAGEKRVVFLFSLPPSHGIDRILESYRIHPLFLEELDRGFERLKSVTGKDDEDFAGNPGSITGTFIFQYALARWLIKLGVKPHAMIGDRWGEYIAACLSGVSSLEEAIEQVISESHLMNNPIGNPSQETSLEKLKGKVEKNGWINREKVIFIGFGSDTFANELCEALQRNHRKDNKDLLWVNMLSVPAEGEAGSSYLLNHIGWLWLYGLNIDWSEFYRKEKRHRISLPTYPFERQRYWPGGNPFKLELAKKPSPPPFCKTTDTTAWLYIPLWKQTPAATVLKNTGTHEKCIRLVFRDESSLCSALVNRLEEEGDIVITVTPGDAFVRIGEHSYVIAPQQAIDYELLFNDLQALNKPLNTILHLWGITEGRHNHREVGIEAVNQEQFLGFFSALYTARAIGNLNFTNIIQLMIITNNMRDITGEEVLSPGKASVLGPCKVIPQEFSHIRCCSIDIVLPEQGTWQEEKIIGQLVEESRRGISDTEIAYRNNCRWTRIFDPLPLEESAGKSPGLRTQGVYLVTGGLGGIGLILAGYMAKKVQARLVLTGRSPFPAEEEREQWLNTHGEDHPISVKIRKIQEFEKLGAEVMVLNADITDEKQMQEAVRRAEARFGSINGVIHAAAAMGQSLFKTITEVEKSDCTEQFKPKMQGIMVLEQVLKDKNPDFCILMSSTSSVLGGMGFCAYSAANNFMDAFARRHNRIYRSKWKIVNWEGWQLKNRQARFEFNSLMDELLMTPEEGVMIFQRLLAHPGIDEVLVSSGDLHYRINRWIKMDSPDGPNAIQTRPTLSNAYTPPGNQVERTIAHVWENFFGIDKVGAEDNLFDLGATSLDIIQINANLRKELKKNIPILNLFTYPTVRSLAWSLTHEEKNMGIPAPQKQRSVQIEMGKESIQTRQQLRKGKVYKPASN
jgi:amino acid adenylation domain-containing protein